MNVAPSVAEAATLQSAMDEAIPRTSGCACGCGLLALALLLAAVAGFTNGHPDAGIPLAIFGLITAGIAAVWSLHVRQRQTVDCELVVTPQVARFGETVQVEARLSARRRVTLTTGQLCLRCRERAINRGGTSDTTYTHLAHDDHSPVTAETTLSEGMYWSTRASFRIPEGLPASFAGRNNFIEWHAHLDLGLKGPLLDLHRDVPFRVLAEVD